MKCVGCGSDDAMIALIEAFPCKHCSKEIRIEYNVCKSCGITWKSVDGEFFSDTTIFDVGLGNLFDEEKSDVSFDELIKNVKNKSYMGDYIHKCLRCQSLAYEVEKNLYRCPICDFEWEVISD